MKLPENKETSLQEDFATLVEVVEEIDDDLNSTIKRQKKICEGALEMCDIIKNEHERITGAYELIEEQAHRNKIILIVMWVIDVLLLVLILLIRYGI